MDPSKTAISALPVIVVADDLIWASRLVAAVDNAGSTSVNARTTAQLERALRESVEETPVVVDLNGRTYDGVKAVAQAAEGGHPVVAVGQHEDIDLRKRALGAGAIRVFSYNKVFTDGPAIVTKLLEGEL